MLQSVFYVADGEPLSWHDLVANLPQNCQLLAMQPNAKWTFIAQTDHPHLHAPWYMLHPCQTDELLRLMLDQDVTTACSQDSSWSDQALSRYMTAWFSLVGPVLDLHLNATQ